MKPRTRYSRRAVLKRIGAAGTFAFLGCGGLEPTLAATGKPVAIERGIGSRKAILKRVLETPMVDTHEHLPDESDALRAQDRGAGWTVLFSHYLDSDLISAGMPRADLDRFLSSGPEPPEKWGLLARYWPAVKNTGYGQAVRVAIQELYGIDEVSESTVERIQEEFQKLRHPGFYRRVLRDHAKIESCQVNSLSEPFRRAEDPTYLMQDISIVGMFAGPGLKQFATPSGIEPKSLSDWHRVIDWWFENYGRYAVAVKSQNAYSRDIDYARVPAERAEPVFDKTLRRDPVNSEERKLLEDHLFWYSVGKATAYNLPVKLHTGYYAGQNSMPLSRVKQNAASACDLCRLSPETRFVFMHICYPYYEEILAVAKHYTNAHIDMCWSWIIDPVAATDYVKKHIVTAPTNKLLPFGGDYIPVEPVVGHASIARRGVARALSQLVDEGWLTLNDAMDLVDPILRGNASRIFNLPTKTEALSRVAWTKSSG